MKGTLHKTENGWEIRSIQATLNGPLLQSIPLHPDDTIGIGQEENEIEFEIIEFPVPPTNGLVNNSISTYAKLVDNPPRQTSLLNSIRNNPSWDIIIKEFYLATQQVPKGAPPLIFECWLTDNYNPPTKKQDHDK